MPSIHILGICGTFMGGIAAIAREAGYTVTGCDQGVYPPMSIQLEALGIELISGFSADQLAIGPDLWVIGNVVSRGNPLMEAIINSGQRYTSGPQWLYEHALVGREVIAVAGTHGKTTTTAMLRHILTTNNIAAGWLIGGVPGDNSPSAGLGKAAPFVIEADEYDTAFFDKRSKFVHYRPRIAILNNLEFDHADIFADLASIQTQFHHLVRTVAADGCIIRPHECPALDEVILRGAWTPVQSFGPGGDWTLAGLQENDASSEFDVNYQGRLVGQCSLGMAGAHNRLNALAAIAASVAAGVEPADAVASMRSFVGVHRRLEIRGVAAGVTIIDDFAHHPTAIALTIDGLRERMGHNGRILAVLEPRSNTMRSGVMNTRLADSVAKADRIYCYSGGVDWDVDDVFAPLADRFTGCTRVADLVAAIVNDTQPGDAVLVMSNGGFDGIHEQLLSALQAQC
ncbi:MAG: UDP-N-acetylmuramate:L-alanyl-gamma-D-glutamyl-meso-diaminopimelate ligase [Burkholderiaceae bacterium]